MKKLLSIIIILFFTSPLWATVNLTDTRVQYSCNGATTTYAYAFEAIEENDLIVTESDATSLVETTLVLNTDYTVTGAGGVGGTVELTSGPVCGSGSNITITRAVDLLQQLDLVDGEAFSAEDIEDGFDKAMLIAQDQGENIGRAVLLKKSSDLSNLEMPNPSPNKSLCWDESGSALTNCDTSTATSTVFDHIGNYDSLADAVSDIGSAVTTLVIDSKTIIADGTTVTTPTTLSLMVINGGSFDGVAGGSTETLIVNGSLIAGYYQILGLNLTVEGGENIPKIIIEWFGAIGDGLVDDTNAVVAAAAFAASGGKAVFAQEGKEYFTTLVNFNQFTTNADGKGQIMTGTDDPLPPTYRYIDGVPSPLSSTGSFLNAFDGDFSGAGTVIGIVVKPGSLPVNEGEYSITPETAAHYSYVIMEAGENGTDTATDRTAYTSNRHFIDHRGGGDAIVFISGVSINTGNAAATSHLEYPAGALFSSSINARQDFCNMAWGESHIEDNGFQTRATGPFLRFTRDNDAETKGEFWNGIRLSSNGAVPVDAGYQLDGRFKIGLDLSMMTPANTLAAIAIPDDASIEFSAMAPTNPISGLRRYAETLNGWTMRYRSGVNALAIKTNNNDSLLIRETGLTLTGANDEILIGGGQVITNRQTGWTIPTGTLDRGTFDPSTITLEELAQRMAALLTDLYSHGLIGD